MRQATLCTLALGLLGAMTLFSSAERGSATMAQEAATKKGTMLAHNVYFSLKDDSPAAQKKLVDACQKYLKEHPGVVFFAAGTVASDLDRPVNDRDFDVALHVVFQDRASHDVYQTAPLHLQFIEENKENWEKVRVFDSYVN